MLLLLTGCVRPACRVVVNGGASSDYTHDAAKNIGTETIGGETVVTKKQYNLHLQD